jgi:hypothetical protein
MSRRSTSDVLDYVGKAWFPVNGPLFHQIKGKLKAGAYDNDRTVLIEDLKCDLSAFAHCLRGLRDFVTEEQRVLNPLSLLRTIQKEALTELLDINEERISPHYFQPEVKFQNQRIKQTIVSCSTAEVLGRAAQEDSDLYFSCALVRQLGLNLVAWNYPKIYSSALSTVSAMTQREAARSLEQALTRTLGLSPLRIGARVALGWNRCPEVLAGIGVEVDEPALGWEQSVANAEAKSTGERIRHSCEISETLARLSDSEYFTATEEDWADFHREINTNLGHKGLTLISQRLDQQSRGYVAISPETFRIDISKEKNLQLANQQYAHKLFEENKAIKSCSKDLQAKFRALYEHVLRTNVSAQGVGILANLVVPACGFNRGCVYLVDERRMMLTPMLRIGDTSLSRFRPLNCNNAATDNPALEALSYSTPLIQENVVVAGEMVSHITGAFGNAQKMGVLYLEMSERLRESDRHRALVLFKAIRQALCDCLCLVDDYQQRRLGVSV